MIKKLYALPFCVLFTITVLAQSAPGGVGANLTLWIKADAAGTLSSTDSLNTWTYSNDPTKVFNTFTNSRPIVKNTIINFLPVVSFDGGKMMTGPNGVDAPITANQDNYAVFGVWQALGTNGASRIWSQRNEFAGGSSEDGVSLSYYNNSGNFFWGDQAEIAPFTFTWVRPVTVGSWYITQLNLLDQSNANDLEISDQFNIGTPVAMSTTVDRHLSDITNRLGARNGSSDETFIGNLAEIAVYNNDVSDPEVRNRIFSYFALKYGIHKTGDYQASDASVYWDATANAGYHHDVFGIGEDDAAGLLTTQSNSVETGNGDGTGQSGKANIVLSNPTAIGDYRFLVMGHDNGSLTESGSEVPSAADASARRLPREWIVQHTGNLGNVDLSIDLTGIAVTGNFANPNEFALMVDADQNGDFTDGTKRYYVPSSITGSVLHFTNITLNDADVFTFLTFVSPVTLPVTWKSVTARMASNNSVVVGWVIDNNASGRNYVIEHSVDGANFTTVGSVDNDINKKSYTFTHNNIASGKHYYRIHQFDLDGKSIYSKVVNVTLKATDYLISLVTNPVRNSYAEIAVVATKSSNATIELWSLSGIRMSSQQQSVSVGTNKFKIAMGQLAAGNYLLKIKVKDTEQTIQVAKL